MNSTTSDGETNPLKMSQAQDFGQPKQIRAKTLDPEAKVFLKVFNLMKRKSVNRTNLHWTRLAWCLSAIALGRADAVSKITTRWIPGPHNSIELKLYWPSETAGSKPAFLWFHGGAFVMGGLTTADAICKHIALASDAVVVAVRYRLAPEHDLYAGRADCLAALDWIAREGHTVGIDSSRLAVGGDSAGGNIAAAVAQRYVTGGGAALRLQVFAYPSTNLVDDFASMAENASGYLLTKDDIDAVRVLISQDQPDLSDPWLSPAFNATLHELPPALVVTAGFDPIRDDGLAYVDRLRRTGVSVELLHYAGQFHGFLNFSGVLRSARNALDHIGSALRRALNAHTDEPAVDRTLELSVPSNLELPLSALRTGRDVVLMSLMSGELLEGWRCSMTRRMLPRNRWTTALTASPFLNPVTACRAIAGQQLAQFEASETYSGNSGVKPGTRPLRLASDSTSDRANIDRA